MSNVESIVSQLAMLSKDDLKKVKSMSDFLLGGDEAGTPSNPEDPFEEVLFQSINAEMQNLGFRPVSYSAFKEMNAYKAWKRDWPSAKEFLQTSFGKEGEKKSVQIAICRIIIKESVTWMRKVGIPVTTANACKAVGKFPQLFDRAFPGYLASGIAYLVPAALLKAKA